MNPARENFTLFALECISYVLVLLCMALEIEVHVIEKCSRQLSDLGTVAAWPETRARRRSVIFDVANGLM
jgi:hypothetical protein